MKSWNFNWPPLRFIKLKNASLSDCHKLIRNRKKSSLSPKASLGLTQGFTIDVFSKCFKILISSSGFTRIEKQFLWEESLFVSLYGIFFNFPAG